MSLLALCAASLLLLVVFFLFKESWPALAGGVGRFASAEGWFPLEGQFGLIPMLLASFLAALGAVLIACPLGLANAIANQFFLSPRLRAGHRALMGLMAGMPSVVIGLWGLVVMVPLIARLQAPGASLLAAIIVLALMILPTIALTSASALASVSSTWLRGATALGMSRWGTILGVALPAAQRGILSGVLLAAARALGETLVVLMVAGNVAQIPQSVFDPVRTLTANIALEMAYAMDEHRTALFVSGFLLMLLVLLIALGASRLNEPGSHAR